MMDIFERVVKLIVNAQMSRPSVQKELKEEADAFRRELHELDRGVGAHLVRGNGAASRGDYITPEDLEDMREDMRSELAEKRKTGRPEPKKLAPA